MRIAAGRLLAMAALLGFCSVLLAAAGSHWVAGLEDAALQRRWQSATLMGITHALALLALSSRHESSRLLSWAAVALFLGACLFSGSLFASILFRWPEATRVAPLGGGLLLLGWLMLFVQGLRSGMRS